MRLLLERQTDQQVCGSQFAARSHAGGERRILADLLDQRSLVGDTHVGVAAGQPRSDDLVSEWCERAHLRCRKRVDQVVVFAQDDLDAFIVDQVDLPELTRAS